MTKTETERPRERERERRAPEPESTGREYEAAPDPEFVEAYESAGIEAPPDWAYATAEQVCAEWAAGSSIEETDQILLEGGIYDYHLQDFSDLIETYFCPGLQP